MKSKPNPASLLKVLLSVAAGIAIGWWGKGMVTGRGSGPQGTVPPTAEISHPGSNTAASPTSHNPTGVNAEESKTLAAQLLQEMLDDSRDKGRDELLEARFQSALAGCDEAAVAEMIETLIRYGYNLGFVRDDFFSLLWKCRQSLVVRMAALNPWKALKGLGGLTQANWTGESSDFFCVLAPLSASALVQAQAVIEKLPPGETRTKAETAWLKASLRYDPAAVFQHLMNLNEATLANMNTHYASFDDLLKTIGIEAPENALQIAARLPRRGGTFQRANLLQHWLMREPKAAAQWAMEQNDAQMFLACFQADGPDLRGLDEKSLRDNFLTIQSNAPESRPLLAENLATRLAAQDIPEAFRWAATLPPAEQEKANGAVADAWIRKDPGAAAEWLATWPAGDIKDRAVESLVDKLVEVDPEAAVTWASSMQFALRYRSMANALNTLADKDPAAAERAFNALSEEDRTVLSAFKRHEAN